MTVLSSYSILLGGISTSSTYSMLGHSREISCFSSTARTDFLIVPLLKTQYSIYIYICAASALNTLIEALENTETWPCLYINSCVLLCFLQWCFVDSAPTRTDLVISRMRNRIFPCYGISVLYLLNLVCIVASFPGTFQVGLDVYSFHFCIHV